MKKPTVEESREFQKYAKENKHLRAPFRGCKVCGGGYWHKHECTEIKTTQK